MNRKMFLPPGKLPPAILGRLLKAYTSSENRVVVGPFIGEDATAIDMGDRYLIAKTDPITLVSKDIGEYAVTINVNDIATMGGKPLWFLATILLPERSTTPDLAEAIFNQLSSACKKIGVELCGGHTEITIGIDRPIIIGVMLGEVEKDALITTRGAKIGDDILLTKAIAIEATSIIAREKEEELKGVFDDEFLRRCKDLIEDPGISILKEAEIARRSGDIHSMHDPTEGGVATGLFEVATAANVGLIVEEEDIPILPECKALCEYYGLNPLGIIASGSLIITLDPHDTEGVIEGIKREGIACSRIGKILPREEGLRIRKGGKTLPLPRFDRDEITRIFG